MYFFEVKPVKPINNVMNPQNGIAVLGFKYQGFKTVKLAFFGAE